MSETIEEYRVLRWEYLECRNSAENKHKYYLLVQTKDNLIAEYGRIGAYPQQHVYGLHEKDFDKIIKEKINRKGYVSASLPLRFGFVNEPVATIGIRRKGKGIKIVTARNDERGTRRVRPRENPKVHRIAFSFADKRHYGTVREGPLFLHLASQRQRRLRKYRKDVGFAKKRRPGSDLKGKRARMPWNRHFQLDRTPTQREDS